VIEANWKVVRLNSASETALKYQVAKSANRLLLVLVSLFIVAVVWSYFAEVDEFTHGEGKIISSRRTQVIQNLEGGILGELMVSEGDVVKQGQILAQIINTSAQSQYDKGRGEYYRLMGDVARLRAEIGGWQTPKFSKELIKHAPQVVVVEHKLFELRKQGLAKEVEILKQQVKQRKQELLELKEKVRGLKRSRKLAKEELTLSRPLAESGAISRTEVIRLERTYVDLDRELKTLRLAKPRGKAALKEALQRVEAKNLEFKSQSGAELANQEARLAASKEINIADKDRVLRTEISSPVKGIINKIHFSTIGGVIKPGDPILEIVPLEENLVVEAWINPADVAFLRPGLTGRIGITAFDPRIYGYLDAVLTDISADTFSDDNGQSFYRIRLDATSSLSKQGETLTIIPGMTASVDILTGKKTILEYLLNPILLLKERALRER
jgi:membrane fusion protein, adhesin transport system